MIKPADDNATYVCVVASVSASVGASIWSGNQRKLWPSAVATNAVGYGHDNRSAMALLRVQGLARLGKAVLKLVGKTEFSLASW